MVGFPKRDTHDVKTEKKKRERAEREIKKMARREEKLDINGYRCANGHLKNSIFSIARKDHFVRAFR